MPKKTEPLDFSVTSLCRYADETATRLGAGQDDAIGAFEHLVGLLVTSAPGYSGRDSAQRRLLYFAAAYTELVQDSDNDDDEVAQLQSRQPKDAEQLAQHVLANAEFRKLVKTLGYERYLR